MTSMRIGIDLGGTKIEGIALDASGVILASRRIASPRDAYGDTLAAVRGLVLDLEREAGRRATVGIGMPGSVSRRSGLIQNANSVWLNGTPFATDVAAALAREVRIANDANCFALSEAIDGAAAGAKLVFGVILGTGVGGGIVHDRAVWSGYHGIAGEWGHNALPRPTEDDEPAPRCYCGRSGCIESYLSGPAFAKDHGDPATDAAGIVARSRNGDPVARAALDRYLDRLARSLASVVNLLDPDAVVLGGGLSKIDEIYAEVPRRLSTYTFVDRVETPVLRNRHGDASGVRGAAWLWPA